MLTLTISADTSEALKADIIGLVALIGGAAPSVEVPKPTAKRGRPAKEAAPAPDAADAPENPAIAVTEVHPAVVEAAAPAPAPLPPAAPVVQTVAAATIDKGAVTSLLMQIGKDTRPGLGRQVVVELLNKHAGTNNLTAADPKTYPALYAAAQAAIASVQSA